MMHQVYFWLANPGSEADRARLIEGLRALGAIEEVLSLQIGTPSPEAARDVVDASWDVCETMHFAGLAEQAAYQVHPAHIAFVDECAHLWSKVVVYDSVPV
jgi:hypothetical protein